MYSYGVFGDDDDGPPKGETIPALMIRNNAIDSFGRSWIAKNRPYNGEQLVAGLSLITTGASECTLVHGFNSMIMGAKFDVAISLADIFPKVSWPTPQSALMSWTETPIDVPFLTNTWLTAWRSGDKDINRGDIFLSPDGRRFCSPAAIPRKKN